MTDEDDDFLDGCECGDDHPTSDEDAPYVALFADQLDRDGNVADEDALARRAAEWRELNA